MDQLSVADLMGTLSVGSFLDRLYHCEELRSAPGYRPSAEREQAALLLRPHLNRVHPSQPTQY